MEEKNDEIYTTIKDFENYAISNYGNVINKLTRKVIKQRINKEGYYCLNLRNNHKKHYMIRPHRYVGIHFIENPDNKACVDHIDGNKLNNYEKNLRWATNAENQQNSKINNKNTSGIKGVYFDKFRNKWCARISLNNKNLYIGRYKTIEEAAIARKNKAKELFGEFLNECEKN
jgi:hypothetical protein